MVSPKNNKKITDESSESSERPTSLRIRLESLDKEPIVIGFDQINEKGHKDLKHKENEMTNPEPEAEHINSMIENTDHIPSSPIHEDVNHDEENDIEKNKGSKEKTKPPFLNLSSTNFVNSQSASRNNQINFSFRKGSSITGGEQTKRSQKKKSI